VQVENSSPSPKRGSGRIHSTPNKRLNSASKLTSAPPPISVQLQMRRSEQALKPARCSPLPKDVD